MTREDVSMFLPKDERGVQLPEVTTGFTVDGNEIDIESYDCYCMIDVAKEKTKEKQPNKVERPKRDPRFWIKVNTNGAPFDPWSSAKSKEYVSAMGKNQWQFYKVSEACFRNYLKFITTHNSVYLRTAHRGISYT